MGEVEDQSHCGASGDIKVTDLVLADYSVLLSNSLEVPVMAFEVLHE